MSLEFVAGVLAGQRIPPGAENWNYGCCDIREDAKQTFRRFMVAIGYENGGDDRPCAAIVGFDTEAKAREFMRELPTVLVDRTWFQLIDRRQKGILTTWINHMLNN